jgi:shikimate dehydrogenase
MLTGATALFPLIADPIKHVRAPAIFQPKFEEAGLDWFLFPLNTPEDGFEDLIAQLKRASNVGGCVVSVPFKARAARICDRLGPLAQIGGVVNTIRFAPDGALEGEILDGMGLINCAAEAGAPLDDADVLMSGTGGAGSAIAFAMAETGKGRLTVTNRTIEKAQSLVDEVKTHYPDYIIEVGDFDPARHSIAINATSLGLDADDPMPFDTDALTPSTAVIDIVVPETRLRDVAAAKGCKVTGGRPMVAAQIAAQIELWQGKIPTTPNPNMR